MFTTKYHFTSVGSSQSFNLIQFTSELQYPTYMAFVQAVPIMSTSFFFLGGGDHWNDHQKEFSSLQKLIGSNPVSEIWNGHKVKQYLN